MKPVKCFRPFFFGLLLLGLLNIILQPARSHAQQPAANFANFEASQIKPIRMSADGTRLYAVNTPNGTLSVFDLTQPANPALIAEIPVGQDPVSANPRTDDEVWVVNQVSGTVSILSVAQGLVTHTIYMPGEPADVVFAGDLAYVSVSQSNEIQAFSISTHQLVDTVSLFCRSPRALAVSPDQTKVYAACAISGNGTTLIPSNLAPPQSAPTNPALPPPPQVSLIVKWNDPNWTQDIPYMVPDHDVAIVNTGATPSLAGYYDSVGTINLGMDVNPATGDLFVANTDARNLIHFETNLQGHFVDNRVTKIQVSSGAVVAYDLNPAIDYSVLPNPAALAIALAQPTNVAFDPGGTFMWITSFGTDRLAQVDIGGNVLSRIEVAAASGAGSNVDPKNKKGPRGLALNAAAQKLYSLNRISNTISVVDTGSQAVLAEIPIGYDSTPAAIRNGRGFLYDAKLSGNGTGSCASCHIDGDMDHLAWDLGNPGANMTTVTQGSKTFTFHPMKGPMTTLTLRGLSNTSPFHWRGDHQNFQAFNPAFTSLMGGPELSAADMNAYTAFVDTILYQPNPNENLDRTLPATLGGGSPATGFTDFTSLSLTNVGGKLVTCNTCHTESPSGPGTNRLIVQGAGVGTIQPLKNPQLRNVYQKMLAHVRSTSSGQSAIDGFGLAHDGRVSDLAHFFNSPIFTAYNSQERIDIAAYMLCFDTGTAPAVGYTRTITSANVGNAQVVSGWNLLQNQAVLGNIDLVARGTVGGVLHGLLYSTSANDYVSDTGPAYTQAQLKALITAGDTLSFMGTYPGIGSATVNRIGPP